MKDDWDDHWNRYADSAHENPAQAYRRRLVFDALKLAGSPARVLDVGSGQGDFVSDLKAHSPASEVLGLELSHSGVELSKKKVPTARFLQRDLLVTETPPPEFRGWATHAVCTEVLEHLENPETLLANIRPFLAPGATLVVTVPGGPMSAFDRHIGHRRHFTSASLRDTLERAGFRVERSSGSGFPFFNLYRLAVIARGQSLVHDVDSGQPNAKLPVSAQLLMKLFSILFRANLSKSGPGWQLVAVARA